MQRQMGQKSPDFLSAHILRMPLAVEHNKTLCPIDVGVFCADTQMFETQHEAHLVEQLGFWLHKTSSPAVSLARRARRLAGMRGCEQHTARGAFAHLSDIS